MIKHKFVFLISLAFFISSCGTLKASRDPEVTPPASPKEGMSTVIGRIVSKETGEPVSGQTVWLAEVYRQDERGAFVLDEAFSPTGRTDANGYFTVENSPAKEYVIVIGNYNAAYDIPEEAGTTRPKTYTLQPGSILDVGEIPVKLEYHP